jgi:hypothetical protein
MENLGNGKNNKKEIIGNKYSQGNLECVYNGLSESQLAVVKKVIDSLAPYLDHKVLVNFKATVQHNPGIHSMLSPEFKGPDDADRIYINPNFFDKTKITDYFLHELGHAFELQLEKIAKDNNLSIFPEGADVRSEYFNDYEFAEFQADFIVGFIMAPEYVKNNLSTPILKDTYEAVNKMFAGQDFSEIKEASEIELAKCKMADPDNYYDVPIYLRAFDKEVNATYKKYFDDLKKRVD